MVIVASDRPLTMPKSIFLYFYVYLVQLDTPTIKLKILVWEYFAPNLKFDVMDIILPRTLLTM